MPNMVLALFPGVVAVVLVGFLILRGIRRRVDAARILDENRLRGLTLEERTALARYLGARRGRWFWPLVIIGVLIVMICALTLWSLGLIP